MLEMLEVLALCFWNNSIGSYSYHYSSHHSPYHISLSILWTKYRFYRNRANRRHNWRDYCTYCGVAEYLVAI